MTMSACDYCGAVGPTTRANGSSICEACTEKRLLARGLDLQILAGCADAIGEEFLRRARDGERKRRRFQPGCRRVFMKSG